MALEEFALYVREQLRYVELYPGTDKQVESLWMRMRIKGQANMDDTIVGVSQNPRIIGIGRAF